MKKFLLNLLKFIAFAIPFYVITICLWSWMMPQFLAKNTRNKLASYGHLYSRAREAENIKNPDITPGFNNIGKAFMPIFDKFHVDVVLSAHYHTYRRHGHTYKLYSKIH